MQPLEIMEDLFFIQRGYLNGNHFAYRGERPVLIDTGYIADFTVTEESIESLGVDLSQTGLIVNTHCHCDHIGGNKIVQDRSSCEIAVHRIGKYFIDSRDDWSTWWRYYHQEAAFFDCTRAVEDGDVLWIGPHAFKVIYTPGHASDGIVLYNVEEKVLISSDTLWEEDMAAITIRVEGSTACFSLMQSMEKLERLDVRVVYPGHGKPFTDMASAIAKTKKRLEAYLRDQRKVGNDQLKKIIIYTLLMKRRVEEASFFDLLMTTNWYPETVDLYFDGKYRPKYDEIMKGFSRRGIIKIRDGELFTTVKP
jgi:glyoxylase-like metal-dependent hydrolase (beta-lactamase superfamily II)